MTERRNENLFCPRLMMTWKDFHKLTKDRYCVSEAKGDLISIGTLLEGRLGVFCCCYGGLDECIHFLGCC